MSLSFADTAVLIVGAGPAGLITALGLARCGVETILVERHPGTSVHPRATGMNLRTMEILRQFGLERAVRAASFDAEPVETARPTLSAPGGESRRLGFPTREEALAVSPTSPIAVPQDALEPIILQAAQATGKLQTWFHHEVESIVQFNDYVETRVRSREGGDVTIVRSSYVVGADGTRSVVRRHTGIGLQYLGEWGTWQSVLFRAPLTSHLAEKPSVIYTIASMERPTLMLPAGSGRWQLAHQLSHPDDILSEAEFLSVIRRATGLNDLSIEVIGLQEFDLVAEVATRYRDGRLFLVGDAAHRMTPSGGAGLNTAVQAAHNLAWKLAYVLKGWADETLLDTYEAERRPIGERNAHRSVGAEPDRRPDGMDIDVGVSYAPEDRGDHSVRFDGRPGTRAPHFWLRQDGRRLSSLDLFGESFVLLAGPQGEAWRDLPEAPMPLRLVTAGRDFDPEASDWTQTYGIEADGAVLIRPDGVVSHRWTTQPTEPSLSLQSALSRALQNHLKEAVSAT